MIEVEEIEGGLRAIDAAKKEVEIEIDGWVPGGEELGIDRAVDVTVAGAAERITVPGVSATIESHGWAQWRPVRIGEELSVRSGDHLVQVDCVMNVYLRFRSPVSIHPDAERDVVTISAPERTPVTIGLRSHDDYPTERVRIPPTLEGIAAAVTASGRYHRTDTPDRSYPSMRRHPPLVELDETASLGDLEDATDGTVTLSVPASPDALFSASPLAYYLGASVEVDDRNPPTLRSGTASHRFAGGDAFPEEVAATLARVFYLDCLVRNVGPYGFDLEELDLLGRLPLDARRAYSMPIGERVAEYLSTPFERIAAELPEWPLSVSVAATIENVPAIPHLLDRLSLILPPEATVLDERTIVERSLGDFYRSASSGQATRPIQPGRLVEPASNLGALQGWIAEGATVDAFKCPPEAFANRLNYLERGSALSVAVVLNADGMTGEYAEVARAYRERADAYSIDVDVERGLTTNGLADVFREGYDFVHYIGHCDPNGLRCLDGNFSASELEESTAGAFFLNACGSYDEGLELVRRGSVAGAVTIGDVLDEQAEKVGATFARLLGRGYNLHQSLGLARNRAIMNRQYAVVGDGTFVPAQGTDTFPFVLLASRTDGERYRLQWQLQSPQNHGGVSHTITDTGPRLAGNDAAHVVTGDEFREFLHFAHDPVIYEGSFYWPGELLDELF